MKCTNCGAELTEDTKFCSYCGIRITPPELPKETPTFVNIDPVKEDCVESKEDEVDGSFEDQDDVDVGDDVGEEYEPIPHSTKAHTTKNTPNMKSSLGDKAKSKFREFWSKLSTFGKISTVSIVASVLLGLIAFLAGRIFAGIIAIVWLAVVVVAILMKKDVIKVPKTWIPLLAVILSFVLVVPYFSLFKVNIADYEKYDWNEVVLADMLPTPKSPYGKIISNSGSYLALYVNKATEEQYTQYIEACKKKGFSIDTETSGSFFYAYNDKGYKLSLSFYDYSSEMHINLTAGKELGTLEWSNSVLAQMLPVPESTVGDIQNDDEKGFSAYVGNISIDAYNSYVQACEAKGFTVDADKTDKRFTAKNADGYKLSVEYQGNNVIYISLDEPEYKVTIEVECVENWIFSKYDVEVYIDDSYEGTITHGDTETFELTLTKGNYVLKFVNDEDDEVDGEVEFYIEKDESLKYKISCTSSKIDVDTIAGATSRTENVNRTAKDGFDSTSNEVYTLAGYTVEIPKYWKSENKIDGGFQRYAETSGKVAMLQVAAQAETDDSYPVTFDGLMDDNDNMIAMIESTAFKDVTDYEVIDTGVIKGILYKGTIVDAESGLTGYGEWFTFASEEDRTWCTLILCQTDNTEYTYTDDFMNIIKSIKVVEEVPPEITPANTAGAPDDWTNLLEKHYEEVKKQFEDAGFTNITCVAHEIDYNEDKVFEGSVVNIAIGENGEICTFAKGEHWDKDVKIRIDYRVKPAEEEKPDTTKIVLPEDGSKLAKDFDSEGKSTIYYINVDGTSNKPTIKTWGSATVTDGVAEYLDYLKELGFTVTITDTSHREPYSGFHIYETNFKVSNSSVSWTMYLCIQKEAYVEYELDVHLN